MDMSMEISQPQKQFQAKHVLAMPWPGLGHINPLMQICRMLSASGVSITFVNTDFNHRHLVRSLAQQKTEKKKNLAGELNGSSGELLQNTVELDVGATAAPIRLVGIHDGVSDQDYIVMDVQKICQALIDMTDRLTELALNLHPPITSVIADIFCTCIPTVARRLQVPHVGFWTQSAASYAAHVLFTRNPAHFRELMTEDDRPIACIPGCPPLKRTEISQFLRSCDPSEFFFSTLLENFGEDMKKHSKVVVNSFQELEAEALEFVHEQRRGVVVMGPMLPLEYVREGKCDDEDRRTSIWREDEGCVAWLDEQAEASVLYVSFGSIVLLSEEQKAELEAGLEASGCKILMVLRQQVEGEDALLPTSFAKSKNLKLVDWAPQLTVLAHPSVGGFLTHAGWNSTIESISNGVPMLCWPFVADQMMNCRCIVDYWQIGLHFQQDESTGLIKRHEIEAKVRCLMDPSSSRNHMRTRARALSRLVKESHHSSFQSGLESLLHCFHYPCPS